MYDLTCDSPPTCMCMELELELELELLFYKQLTRYQIIIFQFFMYTNDKVK